MSSNKDYNERDAETGLHSAIDRLARLAGKGAGLLIRVSTAQQRKSSRGSQRYQQDQVRFLESYRAPTNKLRVFDARGESASAKARRPVFRELIEAVRRREVYVVLVSDADRIARNDPDAEELYDALQEIGGLVVINGEIHDPANSSHRFLLGLRTLIAQYENAQRAFRSLTSKSAKARELALSVKLASGLVWASPEDREFRDRIRRVGMDELITEEALAVHRTKVRDKDGNRYFVFPYPDADVKRACELAVKWLYEEGNLTGLLERIRSDPAWPRPGMFPAVGCFRFDPRVTEVAWRRLLGRDDGRDELARGFLYDWFHSPSIYGTYAATFPRLRKLSRFSESLGSEIRVEDAFPSFATAEDRARIASILRNPDRPRIRGNWTGPRNHSLSQVFCSHPMPYGKICRRKLSAMYGTERGGIYRYLAVACSVRGHHYSLPPLIDDCVIDLILSVFTPERLRDELDRIQRHEGAEAQQIRDLEERLSELEAEVKWHDSKAFRANQHGDTYGQEFHENQHQRALASMGNKRRELEQLRERSDRDETITEKEYEEILQLASDLPELLRRARPIEGKVREILRELISRVHGRRLGTGAYSIEVEFHSGGRLQRTIIARPISASQPIQALAHYRLQSWIKPSARSTMEKENAATAAAKALAEELNCALGTRLRTAWTADRAFTAALMFTQSGATERDGKHSTIDELSAELALPATRVANVVLLGRLGPARVQDGELVVCPTREEIHNTFPTVALRDTALEAGWPSEDTVTLKRLRKETGWDRYTVERVALRGSGVVSDAAGRRYTRRSQFLIPKEGDLEQLLEKSIPADADRSSGEWLTWTKAKERFPGVNSKTFERHTKVVRPGYGENGLSTTYIWIDSIVEARVRKPTLDEAVANLGLPGVTPDDFILRSEALEHLRKRFEICTEHAWRRAAKAGYIIQVQAQGPTSRRLTTYALVPAQVMATDNVAIIEQFLAGKLPLPWRPPKDGATRTAPGLAEGSFS